MLIFLFPTLIKCLGFRMTNVWHFCFWLLNITFLFPNSKIKSQILSTYWILSKTSEKLNTILLTEEINSPFTSKNGDLIYKSLFHSFCCIHTGISYLSFAWMILVHTCTWISTWTLFQFHDNFSFGQQHFFFFFFYVYVCGGRGVWGWGVALWCVYLSYLFFSCLFVFVFCFWKKTALSVHCIVFSGGGGRYNSGSGIIFHKKVYRFPNWGCEVAITQLKRQHGKVHFTIKCRVVARVFINHTYKVGKKMFPFKLLEVY